MYRKIQWDKDKELEITDKGFKLPLKTIVEGVDIYGNSFTEKTILSFISHQGSSFWMTNAVSVGSSLRLVIDLPERLSEDTDLKMIIKGRVVFVEAADDHPSRQRVSLKFENKYIIKPD